VVFDLNKELSNQEFSLGLNARPSNSQNLNGDVVSQDTNNRGASSNKRIVTNKGRKRKTGNCN